MSPLVHPEVRDRKEYQEVIFYVFKKWNAEINAINDQEMEGTTMENWRKRMNSTEKQHSFGAISAKIQKIEKEEEKEKEAILSFQATEEAATWLDSLETDSKDKPNQS